MINAQIWTTSLNLAALTTIIMGVIAIILVKLADREKKLEQKKRHKKNKKGY